jgi:hypothetical protein
MTAAFASLKRRKLRLLATLRLQRHVDEAHLKNTIFFVLFVRMLHHVIIISKITLKPIRANRSVHFVLSLRIRIGIFSSQ